jgi:hypothetical protein
MDIIPYMRTISGNISRLLAKYNIKTICWSVKKSNSLLRLAKDSLGCNVLGICYISCECGKVYVGQTGCTITVRSKEHEHHIWQDQPEKSAVTEHCIELGHKMYFDEATSLARSAGYTDRLVKEAIKIWLHPNSSNRDSGFMLSQAWHPLINTLKKVKQHSDERVQRGHRIRTEETPG